MVLINKLNDFLNLVERFFRRLVAVILIMAIVPFGCVAYLFGLFRIEAKDEEDDYE